MRIVSQIYKPAHLAEVTLASNNLSGLKIRTARKELGVPQGELARAAGISASYLNLIEQNKRPLTESLLDRIAACLGVERRLLEAETEQRIVDELNEISADTVVAPQGVQQSTTEKFVDGVLATAESSVWMFSRPTLYLPMRPVSRPPTSIGTLWPLLLRPMRRL